MALSKQQRRYRIKNRIRKIVKGTAENPRLSVFRSNKQISVQVIDDLERKTLLSASSKEKEIAEKENITKIEQAKLVGELIAKKCLEKDIKNLVFDRNGYLYHGRVKTLAEAARKSGLKL
ncbi:MAG: 50S ribosomal protein L18 [Bacteroidales bacterium]|jgi:large subunit ribosomal protein L18|nr:50S ribosomal protein L18 [Bacteroidales bacterium]